MLTPQQLESPKPPPCPACDLEKIPERSTLSAMALGVGLGAAFGEPHGVTELVCDRHRGMWVVAMCEAAIYLNTPDEDDDANDHPA